LKNSSAAAWMSSFVLSMGRPLSKSIHSREKNPPLFHLLFYLLVIYGSLAPRR
jgi:hypothetical protein